MIKINLKYLAISSLCFVNSLNLYSEETKTLKLDEIIITGQKVEKSWFDTVDSVSVFVQSDLTDNPEANDFFDLLDQMPNLGQTKISSDEFDYSIRGISSYGTATSGQDRTIGVFFDGIPLTNRAIQSGSLSMWDMEKVEVLRGPQGTTTGRNSLAGAFMLKSNDPDFERNGKVKLGYADYNTMQAAFSYTGPISEKLAYRISLDHQETDNFTTNSTLNTDDFDGEKNLNLRAKVLYEFDKNHNFMITFNEGRFEDRGTDGVTPNYFSRTNAWNTPSSWDADNSLFSFDYKVQLSNQWILKSKTSLNDTQYNRYSDGDERSFLSSIITMDSEEDNFNQEILFEKETERSLFVIGLYYGKEDRSENYAALGFPLIQTVTGFGTVTYLIDSKISREEDLKTLAIFYNNDYSLSDKLTLISGLRIEKEDRDASISNSASFIGGTGFNAVDSVVMSFFQGQPSSGSEDQVIFLPKLGLDYQLCKVSQLGFVVQRGYRPGGVSTSLTTGQTTSYDAEYTTNFELSYRKYFNEGASQFKTNLFYVDWQDQQVNRSGLLPFDITVVNAAESSVYGFEMMLDHSWTKFLKSSFGLGHAKTEYDQFIDNGLNYKGNSFAGSRDWTLNANLKYQCESGIFTGIYYSHGDDAFGNFQNNLKLDSYNLVNMNLGFKRDNWQAMLYVTNLFDDEYITFYDSGSSVSAATVGDPRVIGVSASLKF